MAWEPTGAIIERRNSGSNGGGVGRGEGVLEDGSVTDAAGLTVRSSEGEAAERGREGTGEGGRIGCETGGRLEGRKQARQGTMGGKEEEGCAGPSDRRCAAGGAGPAGAGGGAGGETTSGGKGSAKREPKGGQDLKASTLVSTAKLHLDRDRRPGEGLQGSTLGSDRAKVGHPEAQESEVKLRQKCATGTTVTSSLAQNPSDGNGNQMESVVEVKSIHITRIRLVSDDTECDCSNTQPKEGCGSTKASCKGDGPSTSVQPPPLPDTERRSKAGRCGIKHHPGVQLSVHEKGDHHITIARPSLTEKLVKVFQQQSSSVVVDGSKGPTKDAHMQGAHMEHRVQTVPGTKKAKPKFSTTNKPNGVCKVPPSGSKQRTSEQKVHTSKHLAISSKSSQSVTSNLGIKKQTVFKAKPAVRNTKERHFPRHESSGTVGKNKYKVPGSEASSCHQAASAAKMHQASTPKVWRPQPSGSHQLSSRTPSSLVPSMSRATESDVTEPKPRTADAQEQCLRSRLKQAKQNAVARSADALARKTDIGKVRSKEGTSNASGRSSSNRLKVTLKRPGAPSVKSSAPRTVDGRPPSDLARQKITGHPQSPGKPRKGKRYLFKSIAKPNNKSCYGTATLMAKRRTSKGGLPLSLIDCFPEKNIKAHIAAVRASSWDTLTPPTGGQEECCVCGQQQLSFKLFPRAEEPWVQCDRCNAWVHQVCGLFNPQANAQDCSYLCPNCRIADWSAGVATPHKGPSLSAARLPTTPLSDEIELRVKSLLAREHAMRTRQGNALGAAEVPKAQDITVRVVYSSPRTCNTGPNYQRAFGGSGVQAQLMYRQRAIMVFQKLDGVDVLLFAMFGQEYDQNAPSQSRGWVYLAYVDSVKYFRPNTKAAIGNGGEALRTLVYHEVLLTYIKYVRAQGYHSMYVWACPPEGEHNDYIINCRPRSQKLPSQSQLREWYLDLARKAQDNGTVTEVMSLRKLISIAQPGKAVMEIPYFDGDYLADEMEVILAKLLAGSGQKHLGVDRLDRQLVQVLKNKKYANDWSNFLIFRLQPRPALNGRGQQTGAPALHLPRTDVRAQQPGTASLAKNAAKSSPHPKLDSHEMSTKEAQGDGPKRELIKEVDIPCKILGTKDLFLEVCRANHYEFDMLRKAKHSTMMIIFHMLCPGGRLLPPVCQACQVEQLDEAGWKCGQCLEFRLCQSCYSRGLRHEHPLRHCELPERPKRVRQESKRRATDRAGQLQQRSKRRKIEAR
eukprot:evm.model.scf_220.10 EVM.evm.TU.scf_220.10   scf_220:112645-117463(-)